MNSPKRYILAEKVDDHKRLHAEVYETIGKAKNFAHDNAMTEYFIIELAHENNLLLAAFKGTIVYTSNPELNTPTLSILSN